MFPNLRVSALPLLTLLLVALPLWAKTSDRHQEMHIDAGYQDSYLTDNGKVVWAQTVIITQGTLSIHADGGTALRRNGEFTQASFTGTPVKLRQQLDDGTWMDAVADRIDFDMSTDTLTLVGNYTVTSPRGSSSGQRMVYNTRTGAMQSGGDGTRVITVFKPKSAQGAPETAPATQDKP
jgi:lipopolysaccharide export system protein LptA